LLKHIRSLHAAKGRRERGLFAIEGHNSVEAALEARWPLVELLCAPDEERLIQSAQAQGVPVRLAASEVLAYASDAQTSPDVIAIGQIPTASDWLGKGLTLVIDGVGDPGNIGTLLRAADAAGASAILMVAGSADPWSPKVVRSAAGSLFHLPPLTLPDRSPEAIAGLLQQRQIPIVTAEAHGGTSSFDFSWPNPCALILGHETRGISPPFQKMCNEGVTIPIYGRAESLNVAMAGTLLMYSWRQAFPG
jgi:TrmH family RNA methyltransferase